MMADIATVMWKEWRSIFRARGSILRLLLILASWSFFSVYAPWEGGPRWLEDRVLALIAAFFLPTVLVSITIADSFAGERERHTLETLLASRLPDRAILTGKLGVSIIFAWAIAQVMLLVGLVIANVGHWQGRPLFFAPVVVLIAVVGSLLVATAVASLGVIISMRAATAQEATQLLTGMLLGPPMVLGFLLTVFAGQVRNFFAGVGDVPLYVGGFAILSMLTLGLLVAAMTRFQRARLGSG